MARNPSTPRSGNAWAAVLPLGIFCLVFLLGCGEVSPTDSGRTVAPAVLPPLRTRPEAVGHTPCGPLWPEGEEVTLRGLYRTSGDDIYIDVVHLMPDAPPCWARFFFPDRDLGLGVVSWDMPYYLEVTGRPATARWSSPSLWDLQVTRWTKLPFDANAARAACRQAVAAQSTALQEVDWGALATPAYVTGTTGFRPAAQDLADTQVQIIGADDQQPMLLMIAQGPDFPQVRPLVRRWVSVDCIYDLEQERVVELVATIRGEVQE